MTPSRTHQAAPPYSCTRGAGVHALGQQVGGGAVGGAADQLGAPALGRSALGPHHVVAVDRELTEPHGGRDDELGGDRGGPGTERGGGRRHGMNVSARAALQVAVPYDARRPFVRRTPGRARHAVVPAPVRAGAQRGPQQPGGLAAPRAGAARAARPAPRSARTTSGPSRRGARRPGRAWRRPGPRAAASGRRRPGRGRGRTAPSPAPAAGRAARARWPSSSGRLDVVDHDDLDGPHADQHRRAAAPARRGVVARWA